MVDLAAFDAAARDAATRVAAMPRGTRWFVDCDTDADGLCAAAVMTGALLQIGHRVHVRPSRDKDSAHYARLAEAPGDALLLLDKGSSHLDALPRTRPAVVVDHHNVPTAAPDGVHVLNPRIVGLDGSRHASASTTAAALALQLVGDDALRWGPAALAGAIGDWQHRPAWEGWNLALLERCRAAGHVVTPLRPRLVGIDAGDAAARRGLARPDAAALGIDPAAEADELPPEDLATLTSAVALRLLADGRTAAVRRIVGHEERHAALDLSLRTVFRIADACGRLGHAGTGIAFLMGDAAAADEARAHFDQYRSMLGAAVQRLPEDLEERRAIRWAWTAHPALTGMAAGIALESGRVPADKPLCVLARRDDGRVQVSTRALAAHVAAGLDLGQAVHAAARAVGTEGGGHPVAAGAVVSEDSVPRFVDALDKTIAAAFNAT